MSRLITAVVCMCAFAARAEDLERRCGEIDASGGRCFCAESLDSSTYSLSSDQSSINPSNSQAKPCGAGGNFFETGTTSPASHLSIETPTGMPSGSTVAKVWTFSWPKNTVGIGAGLVPAPSVRRLCYRHYFRYPTNMNFWSTCNRKISDSTWNGAHGGESQVSPAFHTQITVNNYIGTAPEGGGDASSSFPNPNGPEAPNSVKATDCMNNWCRVEQCFAGEVQAGNNLKSELHVAQVGVASPRSYSVVTHPGTTGGSMTQVRGILLYNENGPTGTCTQVGVSYSHFMEATWDTDLGQTIGGAFEIEGGSSTPPAKLSKPGVPKVVR